MERRRTVQFASGAVFLAICAVAVLIVVSQLGGGSGGDTSLEGVGLVRQELRGVQQHGTVLGDPGASVRVIEYGDLQCPACRAVSVKIVPDLIDQVVRKGTASYDFRQLTVVGPPPHTQSTLAAKAALAASAQGRYWNFVELFYRNQGTEESGFVTDSFLTAIARGAGVRNLSKWNRDRRSGKWDGVLSRNMAEAGALGLAGTPSFVVEGPGGRRTLGIPSLQAIESAIQAVS